MVAKVKVDPIAKYNLDKKIYKSRAPSIVSPNKSAKSLREALENRIETEVPQRLLENKVNGDHSLARFIPTEIQKRMVWQMAAMGASMAIIQLAVLDPDTGQPISEPMLSANFGQIMEHAREQANFTVALKIYEVAVGRDADYDEEGRVVRPSMPPNLAALQWWDRTRGEARRLAESRSRLSIDANDKTSVTLIIENS